MHKMTESKRKQCLCTVFQKKEMATKATTNMLHTVSARDVHRNKKKAASESEHRRHTTKYK